MPVSRYYTKKLSESQWNQNWNEPVTDPTLVKVPFCRFIGNVPENIVYDEFRTKGVWYAVEQQEAFGLDYHDRYNEGHLNQNTSQLDIFTQMIEKMGLADWKATFHKQVPGQMHMLHMDTAYSEGRWDYLGEDVRIASVKRFFVMLTDWKPGQVIMFGGDYYHHWKRGDVMYFSWPDMPHGTANFGHDDRLMLMVTGVVHDDKFKEVLEKCPTIEIK